MGKQFREGAFIIASEGFYTLGGFVSYWYLGIAWAQGCEDHNGLHACAESGPKGCVEPDGRDFNGVLY